MQRSAAAVAERLAPASIRPEALADPDLHDRASFAVLEPLVAGICGSDLGLLTGRASPYLGPLTSFPAVLGHEVVARVSESTGTLARGTRVVVDPSLACRARGLPPCAACAAGREDDCMRRADPGYGPGLLLGFNRTLPGGWGSRMWAPVSQLYPVPDEVPDERAVLAEPLAIAAAGLATVNLDAARRVLVIGAGSLGLLALWWIATHHTAELYVAARYPHQREWAERLGAGRVDFFGDTASHARLGGSPLGRGPLGAAPFFPDGADVVVDTVGSRTSFQTALTMTRPDGEILVLGALQAAPGDLTPLWSRRITVRGSFGYRVGETTMFPAVMSALRDARTLDGLVTSTWPLDRYPEAIRTALGRSAGSIKVAFRIAAT